MAAAKITPLVAGNWKMNGLAASAGELTKIIAGAKALAGKAELMVCPPATLIAAFAAAARGSTVMVGGQDCHAEAFGAHTGDISAEMLVDAGARAVILGHSERRAERDAGKALDVVGRQLDGSLPDGSTSAYLAIAYEPVWAIGTGRTPTPADVAEVHGFIRKRLTERFDAAGPRIRILYGGSVKPANATQLLAVADVNGALVGGASLKAD